MKWCPECREVKAVSDFPRNRQQRNGIGTYCKPCHIDIVNANREKRNGSARNYPLRRRYGITEDDFNVMLAEQDGLCAICREAPVQHVDHDHATERVRGLLCFNRNGALGQFRDRSDLMQRAIAYLNPDQRSLLSRFPDLAVSLFVGDPADPRPSDEPSVA